MAPIVFGLDLGQMQWSAFKSSNMFGNRDYHLRRTKFIVYQCALIFCVVSESLGTNVLSDYIDQQQFIQSRAPGSYEYNNNYVGAASYNIFAGIYVAFIFGAAFFLDLFWPGRYESKSVRIAWKTTGFLAVLIHLASAITLTCITFIGSAYITGIGQSRARHLLSEFKKDGGVPLRYSHNGRAIAAVVFVWLGWLSVLGSCILLWLSINHTEFGPGPKSAHAAGREEAHFFATTPAARRRATQDLEARYEDSNEKADEKPSRFGSQPDHMQLPDASDDNRGPVTTGLADGASQNAAPAAEIPPPSCTDTAGEDVS